MIYLVRRTNETKGFGVDVERRINSDRKYSLSPNPITVGNLKASQITKNGSTGPFTNNIRQLYTTQHLARRNNF